MRSALATGLLLVSLSSAGATGLSGCTGGDAAPTAAAPAFATCDPGARPVVDGTCAPVGTTSIPDGFADDDGWGFRPVLPADPCAGATIAALGTDACRAIDPCDAAFPPPGATIVVHGAASSFAAPPSLRVFGTLADALDQAPSGATIAVDDGEFVLPDAITKAVRIVGRCAERTALRGEAFGVHVASAVAVDLEDLALTGAPRVAVLADAHADVTLRRVHVRGDGNGANVGNGASLTAVDSVFEGPAKAVNATATNAVYAVYAGHVALDGVEIRGYQEAVHAESVGTVVTVSKSVLHEERQLATEAEGLGLVGAFLGARVTFDGSHVESSPGRIMMVGGPRTDGVKDPTSPGDPPASVAVTGGTLVQSVVARDTGSAIDLLAGASLDLTNVTMRHDSFVGIGPSDGATVTVHDSVVRPDAGIAVGRSAFSGLSRARFVLGGVAVLGTTQAAVVLEGASTAEITGSLVSGNREVEIDDFTAFGGAAQAVTIAPGGHATIHDSAFVGNEGTALFLQGSSAEVDAAVFATTAVVDGAPFRSAITAIDGALAVTTSRFVQNGRALALRGGEALLAGSTVTDHDEAIRLDGLTLVDAPATDPSAPWPAMVDGTLVVAQTSFARNAVRVATRALTDE